MSTLIEDACKLNFRFVLQLCEGFLNQAPNLTNCISILLHAHYSENEPIFKACLKLITVSFSNYFPPNNSYPAFNVLGFQQESTRKLGIRGTLFHVWNITFCPNFQVAFLDLSGFSITFQDNWSLIRVALTSFEFTKN